MKPDFESNGMNNESYRHYQVIRRNGTVTGFDASKIAIAITKAFLAVEGRNSDDHPHMQSIYMTRITIDVVTRTLSTPLPKEQITSHRGSQPQSRLIHALYNFGEYLPIKLQKQLQPLLGDYDTLLYELRLRKKYKQLSVQTGWLLIEYGLETFNYFWQKIFRR